MSKTDVTKLETESKKLDLSKAYDALFSNASTSKTYTECKVFESGTQKNDGAKKLCSKLLYLLENIAKNPTAADNVKRCSYLRYWFYDEIWRFHNDHSKKISEISFIKELTDIRKKEYYEKHCRNGGFLIFSPVGTDYFPCSSSYEPSKLLAALKLCKPPEPPKSRISSGSASVSGRVGGVAPIRNDAGHGATAAVPSSLDSASNKMDSNFIRDIIMGVAVIGTILFLFFYNMSSGLKFSSPLKERKKKKLKHNYYEEYEKEFEKYGSEDMSLDSEDDRYYLNYQPEGDYDY
ncbi:Plasmodium vivax Vir protein, putative [Plasmodium vivax]|uniref:Vir protein, putative n=1 Tax=Plasmodium vivax TaxID=5855 RepID=A0A1G4E433_PLAVI|nr:Plasmodium vivax Vir protein, putative [Plasmodium vivax]